MPFFENSNSNKHISHDTKFLFPVSMCDILSITRQTTHMNCSSPLTAFGIVGRRCAPLFKKLGIATACDLLYHFPYRWDDLRTITPIADLGPDRIRAVKGTVQFIENKRSKWKRMALTHAVVSDESGSISVLWFNQPFLTKNLKQGDNVYLWGKIEYGDTGFQMTNPEYEKVMPNRAPTHVQRIVPRYPSTAKLSQKQIRFLMAKALPLASQIKDFLPAPTIRAHNLLPLPAAIRTIHFPPSPEKLARAQERLKFDELFLIQLHALRMKQALAHSRAIPLPFPKREMQAFVKSLPFSLTPAQKKAAWEILKDLQKQTPMNRLLEGDVGSGKTVVAAMALLQTALSKKQAAYLAPTEILARQIFTTLCALLSSFPLRIALLTRTENALQELPSKSPCSLSKRSLLSRIRNGDADIVVGTHAIIQKSVRFSAPALAVVDEQHRFGVRQRSFLARLSAASESEQIPHFLSMSATPIPRSLALTVYGDLDLSVIGTLPPGRKPVHTKIIPPDKRHEAYQRILKEISKGRQAYVICPLIDPSDRLGVKSATEEYRRLQKDIFPTCSIGLLHGRMAHAKKEEVMQAFLDNKINILVSTTVVEVGVDVPNATLMLIEGAERFGLAQLHQLRGRVGRSSHQSYCFLFSETSGKETLARLSAFAKTQNGFELAEKDMEIRGPGDIYGVKQSGYIDRLRIAKLTDYPVIQKARNAAHTLLKDDPTLKKHPLLQEKIKQWEQEIHLE